MELKESALATIGITLILLIFGVLTGGILFYVAAALAALFFALDYYRLVRAERDIQDNVEVKSGLSRNEIYLDASTQLVCRLVNNGMNFHRLKVDQKLDDSIRSNGVWQPIELSGGSTVYLKMMLTPAACGIFNLDEPELSIESWLFMDSFALGKKHKLIVQLPVGVNLDRVGPASLRSKSGPGMFEATMIKGGHGLDFKAVRQYVGGDNTRHIDWARSSRMRELMVRDYEDEQPLPVFFFIDLDHSMGIGDEPTALHTAVELSTELVNKFMISGERIGLAGFSRSGVARFLPPRMGNDHLYDISSMLSSMKTVDSEVDIYRQEQDTLPYELKTLFKTQGQSSLLIDDAIRVHEANIKNDGFSRSIRSAIRYLNTPSRMVVITNLSMGLVSLMNNVRIAAYYGHKVSVVLIPHTWHEEKEQSDDEVCKAAYTLKANGIDAIVIYPGEEPESIVKRGGLTSIKARVRR
jgi:uncharacterized protein (DUF58 family)